MRSAVRVLSWGCVAAVLLGGCKRWRSRPDDAGVVDAGPRGPTTVQFPSADDSWPLVGTLTPGAVNGPQVAVLLLHQLGSNRAEWGMLVQQLQRPPAITVLAVDLRGHGDSAQNPQGARQTWESFGDDPALWAGLARDARAGAQYLLGGGGALRIVVVGSSIGASAAVMGLAEERGVVGLAMISPGVAYHGLDISDPMQRYVGFAMNPPRTAWLMAGERDVESVQALTRLAPAAPASVVERVLIRASEARGDAQFETHSDAHGVSLLNLDGTNTRWGLLNDYIRKTLRSPPRATGAQR